MLKAIIVVTILSHDVDHSESTYADFLAYKSVEKGVISTLLAESWGAKEVAGADYVVMQPSSGKPVFLRFVEQANAADYQPMRQLGWNATEILVEDPDALAEKLRDTDFSIVGEPKFLTDKQNVRAFQALGPSSELLYFTRIIDPAKSSFDLGMATSYVDNVFIMVSGSRDLARTTDFYQTKLNTQVAGPFPYRVGVLSRAYGLPNDTLHNLSLAQLPSQFLIELDQYPAQAKSINKPEGGLPAGVALVTFEFDQLAQADLKFITPPSIKGVAPYRGRLTATIKGPDGELIELVESQQQGNSQ